MLLFGQDYEDYTEYVTDGDGYAKVYTDGACSNNGRGYLAKAGIGVYWGPYSNYNVSEPVSGPKATNQVAEIQAVCKAIKQALRMNIRFLRIYLDSQFVKNCAESWIPTWKNNGWTKSDGTECRCKADLIVLDKLLCNRSITVKFMHVIAHSGNDWNDKADTFARQGARFYSR